MFSSIKSSDIQCRSFRFAYLVLISDSILVYRKIEASECIYTINLSNSTKLIRSNDIKLCFSVESPNSPGCYLIKGRIESEVQEWMKTILRAQKEMNFVKDRPRIKKYRPDSPQSRHGSRSHSLARQILKIAVIFPSFGRVIIIEIDSMGTISDVKNKLADLIVNQDALTTNDWGLDSDACYWCEENFSAWKRRHHCRNCGQCVCDTCSPHRMALEQNFQRSRRPPNRRKRSLIRSPGSFPENRMQRSGSFNNKSLQPGTKVRVCDTCFFATKKKNIT